MKKLIALFLSLVMIFTFAACSNGEPEGWYSEDGIKITKREALNIINGEFEAPKNVIVLIGDGMGPNDLILAKEHVEGVYDFGLVLDLIENQGLCTTHSANEEITDSAAAGTALSTGVKTNNGLIGKAPNGTNLQTMAELAREQGKKVGIITDEALSGATPTAFTVHNDSRYNTKELINSMIAFKPDVLMCQDYRDVYITLNTEEKKIFEEECLVAKDFSRFKETLDTDPENKKPFIGFLEGYSSIASDNLAQGTQVALKRLKNENGFFLMVESSGTDKFGHKNDINGKLNSVVTLDRTLAAILHFMKNNPDTLLVVTSDHETGGVKLPEGDEEYLSKLLTTEEHTATPVKVFAVGKGSEYFKDKNVDNTDIGKFLIKAIKGE